MAECAQMSAVFVPPTDGNAIGSYNQARAVQNNKGQRRTFLIY